MFKQLSLRHFCYSCSSWLRQVSNLCFSWFSLVVCNRNSLTNLSKTKGYIGRILGSSQNWTKEQSEHVKDLKQHCFEYWSKGTIFVGISKRCLSFYCLQSNYLTFSHVCLYWADSHQGEITLACLRVGKIYCSSISILNLSY